ncbi:PASTA domain-containing protein [Kribbella sp. NPDC003557]|uniref:PASTA domain-containing protein n=1 Tax=Kribbella sp. NPDC003557 TaxID=3154449 RepID=UPI0033BA7E9C
MAQRWWTAALACCATLLPASCGTPGSPTPTTTVTSVTTQTASPSVQTGVVPNVVGLNHQLAQDTMQAAGFYYLAEEDATGQGRALLNDRNWVVVTQSPTAGTSAPPDTKITLRSKKIGE